jgi:hypothetical protein
MSRRASVSAALATLALSLGAFAPAALSTANAASCTAAPKQPAPQGQHWYYRTDRSLGRKCWYLASEGRKGEAAPRAAAADPDDDATAQPAAPMAEAAARLTEPLRSPPPPWPAAASAIVAQADANAPIRVQTESIRSQEPAAVATAPEPVTVQEPSVAEQTLPAAAPITVSAPAPERINLMQFVFVALVGLCLLAGLFVYLAAIRRRRDIRIVDLNTPASLRMPAALTDSPSVAPDSYRRDDGDDERPRRFSQAWKRQTA